MLNSTNDNISIEFKVTFPLHDILFRIEMPEKLELFVNKFAEQEHDTWSLEMFAKGWVYGSPYNEQLKHHPMLKPYRLFNDKVSSLLTVLSVIHVLVANLVLHLALYFLQQK